MEITNVDFHNCPICREEIDFYSYGSCNHPTCSRCAIKLRLFGSVNEPDFSKCPTCRCRLNRIIFMTTFLPYEQVDLTALRHEMQFDFLFENEKVEACYKNLIDCKCSICNYRATSMHNLNAHCIHEHNLSYCELCLRNSRLLPSEFIAMTPDELIAHRTWNKKKKRGHPVCEFCNQTFYEFEDLVKHVRDAHFSCDFCHSRAIFEVFRRQDELFHHYRESHFVCPECDTRGQMSYYASIEQLGIHRLHAHPQEAAEDPNQWDPVKIHYSNTGLIGQQTRSGVRSRNFRQQDLRDNSETRALEPTQPRPDEWTGADFPSLTGEVKEMNKNVSQKDLKQVPMASIVGSRRSLKTTDDDFPTLPSNLPSNLIAASTKPTANWVAKTTPVPPKAHEKKSLQVPNVTHNHDISRATPKQTDFPQLISTPTTTTGCWPHPVPAISASNNLTAPLSKSVKQCVPNSNDFPGLNGLSAGTRSSLTPKSILPPYRPPQVNLKQPSKKLIKNSLQKPPTKNTPITRPHTAGDSHWRRDENHDLITNAHNEDGVHPNASSFNHIQTITPNSTTTGPNDKNNVVIIPEFSVQDFPDLSLKKSDKIRNEPKTNKPKSQEKKKTVNGGSGWGNENQIKQKNTAAKQVNKNMAIKDLVDTETVLFNHVAYTPPLDVTRKNQTLIQVAEKTLNESYLKTSFNRFTDLSRQYRHGQLTADAYISGLDSTLGSLRYVTSGNSLDWLASMISLLPDVGLQRGLLRVLKGDAAPRIPNTEVLNRAPRSKPPIWSKLVLENLRICQICGQVCLRTDMKEHTAIAHS